MIQRGPKIPVAVPEPLHVRTARALGWTEIVYEEGGILLPDNLMPGHRWKGVGPNYVPLIGVPPLLEWLPCYDSDWSATGWLIEKHHISLTFCHDPWTPHWAAYSPNDECDGETALIAVCRLILTMTARAKL